MKAALNLRSSCLRAEITSRPISFLKAIVKMASGRHIMPLMFSSMLQNRDMMPLVSTTTEYRGRVPASVSAELTAAITLLGKYRTCISDFYHIQQKIQ